MTNIAQFGYSVIRKSITYGSRTKAAAADDISNGAFSDSLPELGSGAAELVPPVEENGIPKRWTTDSLYEWDSSPKGYSVNAAALSRVREQLRSEGINADSRTPTHEITDEQMERLESRYDLEFINACSKEHPEFGNFMLDLAYMNVFSLDEVENFFGVLPPTSEYQAVSLYYHGDPKTGAGAGYVDIFNGTEEIIGSEEWQTRHITKYIKSAYGDLAEDELKKMTREIIDRAQERMDILDSILKRIANRTAEPIDNAFLKIEDVSEKLKEDFGGLGRPDPAETVMDKLIKNAPDKWTTEPGLSFNAIKAALEFRENELGIKNSDPTHELTPEQREWLYSRHDLSTMQMYVRFTFEYGGTTQYQTKATAEYSNFVADLAYLGVYSYEEFIQVSPLDTRANSGDTTLSGYLSASLNSDGGLLDNAKLFVEHLQNMFNFYNERSKDPHKAIEGDAEFAALIKEHYLPFYQQFFEFVDDLINNDNEQMPQ